MARGQQADPGREARWRAVLARHGKSGLSVRAFCEREGVPESAFYAWRRTIQQRDAARHPAVGARDAAAREARPSTSGARLTAAPAFVPLVLRTSDAAEGQVVVELRGGRVLRLPITLPPGQLAAIVHAIEGLA